MLRALTIPSILALAFLVVPACQGDDIEDPGALTQGSGTSSTSGSPCFPCCEDNPQFPIQQGDSCIQCINDSDCMNIGFTSAYGLKCQPDGICGCAVDNDCVGDGKSVRCLEAESRCVECLSNADCATSCNPLSNTCVACSTDAECSTSAQGPHCSPPPQGCRCTADAECASSSAGPLCLEPSSDYATCGCSDDAECAGSAQGHVCTAGDFSFHKHCGCSSDADCDATSSCQTTAHRCLPN